MDFLKHFEKYEKLVKQIEDVFSKVKSEYPENIKCKPGCSDCCHALFDLTLVEAVYIKSKFDEHFEGKLRHDIITYSNSADRKIYKLKKDAAKKAKEGKGDLEIIGRISKEKIKCPLLNDDDKCRMYEYRPIACRVYGIPTSAAGFGHTCGASGFEKGKQYPTLNMDIVYNQLYSISKEFVRDIESTHKNMDDMLVPLSMALLTDYNENYLGLPGLETIG